MIIPIDAESVETAASLEEIKWPIRSAEYKAIAEEVKKTVFSFSRYDNTREFYDIYCLKVRNIFFTVLFLSYLLLTKTRVDRAGYDFISSERCFLFNAIVKNRFPENSVYFPKKQAWCWKTPVKSLLDRIKLRECRSFCYGSSQLICDYIKQRNMSVANLYWKPNQNNWQGSSRRKELSWIGDFPSDLALRVKGAWKKNDIPCTDEVVQYLSKSVRQELLAAARDVSGRLGIGKKGGKLLLVGTGGHYPNRLLSYYFLRDGHEVIRFDHGGERALFRDIHWGVNEFYFLDKFVTFGKGMEEKAKTYFDETKEAIGLNGGHEVKFTSTVNHGLKDIFEKAQNFSPGRTKKVMILMPALLGDWIVPGHYAPDIVSLKIIWKTIRELKEAGFYVILKKHPKTLRSKMIRLFDRQVDEVNDNFFAESIDMADAFVFFYCGTAFCEALMTKKPITYIHLPYRNIDPKNREELERCLCWIDCQENNEDLAVDCQKIISYMKNPDNDLEARRSFVEKHFLST